MMALGVAAMAVLLFVWGGYPLLLRLAAAGRQESA